MNIGSLSVLFLQGMILEPKNQDGMWVKDEDRRKKSPTVILRKIALIETYPHFQSLQTPPRPSIA